MLFNTFQFALFLVIVLALYRVLPERLRNPLLLAASYYFYMCWNARYLVVILAITVIDFAAGIMIQRATLQRHRRFFLFASIAANFGLLFLFKYYAFAVENLTPALRWAAIDLDLPALHLLLPVGISFHTFQAVSYTIDVYRRKVPAERSLLRYALFVAFFPQMVAGPIERAGHLQPQFRGSRRPARDEISRAIILILWGLFKKVAIADLVSASVSAVYGHPRAYSGPALCIATLLFAIQIYCDFSGYSDMAVGIALLFGFDLTRNFRQPYFANSIVDFWRRWHISLSTWFRDYLYIPLGGGHVKTWRKAINIFIVFLLSGLWHGANWTFIIWGALHGIYLVASLASQPIRASIISQFTVPPAIRTAAGILTTFTLSAFAWIFFRAANVSDATYIASHIWNWNGVRMAGLIPPAMSRFESGIAPLLIAALLAVDCALVFDQERLEALWRFRMFRWVCYNVVAYAIVFFGVFDRHDFIYFQF